MNYNPTTELDAVNVMLSTIGEAPVSSLEVSGLTDVAIAKTILNETSKAVQSRGWHFNSEINYELSPTVDGHLLPPTNTLRIDPTKLFGQYDVTHRGTKLYNREKHTYVFTDPIKFDLILMLAFDEMPEAARYYITIRASRIFQRRMLGAETLEQFTAEEEGRALVVVQEAEGDTGDHNVLSGSHSVAGILGR